MSRSRPTTTPRRAMPVLHLRRSIPTVAIAGALLALSATSGAAALVITGKQIKDGTITTKDVKNGSLTSRDLTTATVTALKGSTGPAGPAGSPGISDLELRHGQATVPPGSGGFAEATCTAGRRPISVAGTFQHELTGVQTGFHTIGGGVWGMNTSTTSDILSITLDCARVS